MQLHKIYGEKAGRGFAVNLREAPSEGTRAEPRARRGVVVFFSFSVLNNGLLFKAPSARGKGTWKTGKKRAECEIMGSRARGRDNDQREPARTGWEKLFWLGGRAAASDGGPCVRKISQKKKVCCTLSHTRRCEHPRTWF